MQTTNTVAADRTISTRHFVLFATIVGSLAVALMLPPIAQDSGYHAFADRRAFFGVPAFLNVASNLGFLIVGVSGVAVCFAKPSESVRSSWITLFAGIIFITFGSAYYHLAPGHWPLVWDRLPMTVGFMGLLVALLSEYVDGRLRVLLLPALIVGASSVAYWYLADDLRLYMWVQALPLMMIPVLLLLFRPQYSGQWLLGASLGFYALAKAAEFYDRGIFAVTSETISGHTVKHLLSSAGCGAIAFMLHKRSRLIR